MTRISCHAEVAETLMQVESSCVRRRTEEAGSTELLPRLREAFQVLGASCDDSALQRLARQVSASIRHRENAAVQTARLERAPRTDIYYWIHQARADQDSDEAIWRSFLAGHFGRPSARRDIPGQTESAARVLCAFEDAPVWTWARVYEDSEQLRRWLYGRPADLSRLSFGNHRKYESAKPAHLWRVVSSFLEIVGDSPAEALRRGLDDATPTQRFQTLYQRFSNLHRFGRTGVFDFLVLLVDLGLLEAEPDSCYLVGATGPLKAARLLWPGRSDRQVALLADRLARQLALPATVIEDALCNWQK